MAAIVRVKRSLDEEPNTALILSCKRRKTDAKSEDAVETLFKFARTVKDQEENIVLLPPEEPDKLSKNDLKTLSRHTPNVSQKSRSATKVSSQSNRYKLVNYFRAIGNLNQTESAEDGNQKAVTVLDVEADNPKKQTTPDSKPLEDNSTEKSGSSQYVYDLYYIESDAKDIDDLLLDGLVSFAPIENELVFDSYRNNKAGGDDSDSDAPFIDDEDDSNDENNWRNDYPDDDEGPSDDDDDGGLAKGFGKITFGDEELSSDGDDERLIYTEELSPSDVNLYGSAYARFKKKALREMDSCVEINSDSDDEHNLSKSDDSVNGQSDVD